jgi:hypothetical protein
MLSYRFPTGMVLGRLAGALLVLATVVAFPARSHASTVADCFKTATGYNAFVNGGSDVVAGVTFAVEHPDCAARILDTTFEALSAAAIVAKEAGLFTSEDQCRYIVTGGFLTGPAKKALADAMNEKLPDELIPVMQSYGEGQMQQALNKIPGFELLPCACSVAFSGLSITKLRSIIATEVKGIKACSSLVSGAVSTIEDGVNEVTDAVGLTCDHKKMGEVQYYQQFLAPQLDTYALATDKARHVGCYDYPTGSCRAACMNYYTSGSAACRMKPGNASHLCDVIFQQFDPQVMARQPVLVALALAACSPMGDGCVRNKDFPALVIDTYGQDTLDVCLGMLKNTYKTPGCIPTEQPCCWRAPWPPALKCKKARAEAAAHLGNLAGQIGQDFSNLPPAFADAQMIAERKACQQAILGNTLKYVQDAACDAAAKTPTDDFSGIWPEVLKQAKGVAGGEAYTKCDGPYNKRVRINGCKDKCAQPGTLMALYKRTDASASTQCFDDCMSGKIVGRMKTPGLQQSKTNQQTNCLSQCFPLCDGNPGSAACKKCQDACATAPGSGTGSSTGAKPKPKVGTGGIVQ